MQQSFADGKYTVIYEGGKVTALRYGEPWQDLTGNNLVYWMLVEVDKLRENPPAPTAQPKLPFADVCAMLPADVSWGDPLTPAMAREIAQNAQPVPQPGAERWVVVRQSVLDVGRGDDVRTGGKPELGYALISDAGTFDSQDEAMDAIKSAGLPTGWVCMPVSRLLPDLFVAAPAQRQPLTHEQIAGIATETTGWLSPPPSLFCLARAIEAAHGITAAPAASPNTGK